jgi:hypothetical protein
MMEHRVELAYDGSHVSAVHVHFLLSTAVTKADDLDLRIERAGEGAGCVLVLRGAPEGEHRVALAHEVDQDRVCAKFKVWHRDCSILPSAR